MKETLMIDGYKQFFDICPKEKFIDFGINNIISISTEYVDDEWNILKSKIINNSNDLYIRNSGRNGTGNKDLANLYSDIFNVKINYDLTNNNKPTQLLTRLTGHRKNKTIFNYQVSHVFGNTKNVYMFTAPWNIVFIPKIIDPFTGHEAIGDYVTEFKCKFKKIIYEKFKLYIQDYNSIIKSKLPLIHEWIKDNLEDDVGNKYMKEFTIIPEC